MRGQPPPWVLLAPLLVLRLSCSGVVVLDHEGGDHGPCSDDAYPQGCADAGLGYKAQHDLDGVMRMQEYLAAHPPLDAFANHPLISPIQPLCADSPTAANVPGCVVEHFAAKGFALHPGLALSASTAHKLGTMLSAALKPDKKKKAPSPLIYDRGSQKGRMKFDIFPHVNKRNGKMKPNTKPAMPIWNEATKVLHKHLWLCLSVLRNRSDVPYDPTADYKMHIIQATGNVAVGPGSFMQNPHFDSRHPGPATACGIDVYLSTDVRRLHQGPLEIWPYTQYIGPALNGFTERQKDLEAGALVRDLVRMTNATKSNVLLGRAGAVLFRDLRTLHRGRTVVEPGFRRTMLTLVVGSRRLRLFGNDPASAPPVVADPSSLQATTTTTAAAAAAAAARAAGAWEAMRWVAR